MADKIFINGIETNNLKGIDISLEKKSINLIIGPSGSGKSSLAYDTIAQIGQHEFLSMFADDIQEPSYKVKSFSNMVAAIPIKQNNHNNNIRSTIGTYFGMNRSIGFVYAALLGVGEDLFVLNKESNLCEHCHGLGVVTALDENKIVDYNIPIEKNPFRCWNKYKDFYSQILIEFCKDNKIDSKKTFRQLSNSEKHLLLYGESESKYSIRYKKTNAYSRRTTKFFGVLTGNPMLVNHSVGKLYYSDIVCAHCKGEKYSHEHRQYKIYGLSIGEFMSTPFNELLGIIYQMVSEVKDDRLIFTLQTMYSFVKKAVELNLGHLFFHRSIPTLSGGELQRLRMVQVFNTQLSDLLIVLDEPLAGLSGEEKKSIYENILNLSKRHTLVIVDHSDIFVNESKNIVALGEKGGNDGGFIIDYKTYLKQQNEAKDFKVFKNDREIPIKLSNPIYDYKGVNVSFAEECMNLITGQSGVGKSTLLREYLPQCFEHYTYINQKPLNGNKNSFVATALDVFGSISDIFAKKHKKDKRFFSNLTGNEGMCPICQGAGYIEYGYEKNKISIECQECEGTGFNKNLKKYKICEKSIFDVWKMTIDEACEFFKPLDSKIHNMLVSASSIMLGHLKIGQPTSTLSGGENIRVKILKSSRTSAKILGIDEPFKGLSSSEIYKVVMFLESLRKNGKTIVVIDHTDEVNRFFAKQIKLKNNNGILSE
ncbi:MAG: ATP-binding cassette domain-containing protein [Ruminococcaceae bacterium]|nr:ATP-binding cassette domain-containing protein [Oscillospiraceae bacterium]